jgi:hypothetical protein
MGGGKPCLRMAMLSHVWAEPVFWTVLLVFCKRTLLSLGTRPTSGVQALVNSYVKKSTVLVLMNEPFWTFWQFFIDLCGPKRLCRNCINISHTNKVSQVPDELRMKRPRGQHGHEQYRSYRAPTARQLFLVDRAR